MFSTTATSRGPTERARFVRSLQLSRAAEKRLPAEATLEEAFDLFRGEGLTSDAVIVLPHLLPKRVAIWWGLLCAWQAYRPAPEERVAAALEGAVRWITEPCEEHRIACEPLARQAGKLSTAAGCLAQAVVYSGGSLAPPHLPLVPPPRELSARLVSGAVRLAAVERDPLNEQRHLHESLAVGLEVAAGRQLWTSDGTPATARGEQARDVIHLPDRRRRAEHARSDHATAPLTAAAAHPWGSTPAPHWPDEAAAPLSPPAAQGA